MPTSTKSNLHVDPKCQLGFMLQLQINLRQLHPRGRWVPLSAKPNLHPKWLGFVLGVVLLLENLEVLIAEAVLEQGFRLQ